MSSVLLGSSANTIGELVDLAQKSYKSFGWNITARLFRSHDAANDIDKLPHPAAPLLDRMSEKGVPAVLKSEPWSQELLDERAKRGCHTSANDYVDFLQEEFLDFGKKGFWVLLPYDDIKDEPGLRLSPLGCVPQEGRRPRVICDYSYWGINEKTVKLAPEKAMQFGTAPLRIRQTIMRANPKFGPVYMYKNDLSDGFYRIRLTPSGALKLAVLLPNFPGLPRLVALPLVLPMGWTESPPWFCAFTETIADLTNDDLKKNKRYPSHPLEEKASITDFQGDDKKPSRPIPKSHQRLLYRRPLKKMEIFVDDFVGIGQDHPSNPLTNQRATLSHNIDKLFRPNRADDPPWRKEPQSQSKMAKGDASWHQTKEGLGWIWGANSKTLQMTPKRVQKAETVMQEVLSCKRVSVNRWQQLIGILRSLQPGMSGSEGHFSLLQDALVRQKGGRVTISPAIREQLEIFRDFITVHQVRPTYLEELVPGEDRYIGSCDAAKPGRGGVWFLDNNEAVVWRSPYPKEVQERVVSFDNPKGTLTNSDLELEGTILHQHVIGKLAKVQGETTYTGCDNSPAVAWRTKGSSTTAKARAHLLRIAAAQTRYQQALHRIGHLAGIHNQMSDDASRLWELNDKEFLTYFNSTYPQKNSWRLYQLPSEMSSLTTSALLNEESNMESVHQELQKHHLSGSFGQNSATPLASIQDYPMSQIQWSQSCSLGSDTEMVESHPQGTRSWLERQKMPCVRWDRPSPNWVC